jgi:hypothetical protein
MPLTCQLLSWRLPCNLQFIHPKLQNKQQNPPKTTLHARIPPSGTHCSGLVMMDGSWIMDSANGRTYEITIERYKRIKGMQVR